ncbi:anti-sigma factor [Glacieibacterium megasporae]|uniref:anti-sigma factor n=1 Tax=Glacieibacterium megasporae TaxID=2835787 RepID=UPI001C1E00E8|nr:anti-sigma factor [Polymorphobacter megasporae]UAJ10694.1 anti-sigma factor [Polymorphobacter megasporae]
MTDEIPEGSEAALALDFALGALDGQTMRRAELRLRSDPAFAREVSDWQARLAPLADAIAPVEAPRAVWDAVDHELFRVAASRTPAASKSLWAPLAVWRAVAFGASGVAAIAIALLVSRPGPAPVPALVVQPPGALLAASMAATDSSKAVLITATYDPARGAVILTPAAADSSRGLTPELWIIVGKDAPRSLGVIDLKDPQAHRIPAALRAEMSSGATLAISLEPPGGSRTGAPTGPVVAAGKLAPI